MTEAEALELVEQRFTSQWPSLQPGLDWAYENEAFRGTTAQWAAVFVRHTTSKQVTQGPEGSRKFERKGNIVVQLFSDVDVGRGPIAALVATIRTIYEARTLVAGNAPVWTYAAASAEGGKSGKSTDGRWWQENVTIPITYYETR